MSAAALLHAGLIVEEGPALSALPAAPRRVRIGMPQLDAGGLSEGWLHRYCGDLHWEAIGRELGVSSDGFRAAAGERLYPTVVAVRARYGAPLAAFGENDVLTASVAIAPCGRACAHGRIELGIGGRRAAVELVTTFAVRDAGGGLRMAVPSAELAARWDVRGPSPALAVLAKAARAGQTPDDPFCGPFLPPAAASLGRWSYEPSPFADYNGARLLYFASYPTIADTAERALVRRLALSPWPRADWALAASVVRRDVFFYANLPLGEALVADLHRFDLRGEHGVVTHVRLRRQRDERVMADLVTERRFWQQGR